jgi:hypothetical protein
MSDDEREVEARVGWAAHGDVSSDSEAGADSPQRRQEEELEQDQQAEQEDQQEDQQQPALVGADEQVAHLASDLVQTMMVPPEQATPAQRELREQFVAHMRLQCAAYQRAEAEKQARLEAALQTLSAAEVDAMVAQGEEAACMLCLDAPRHGQCFTRLPCGHVFHSCGPLPPEAELPRSASLRGHQLQLISFTDLLPEEYWGGWVRAPPPAPQEERIFIYRAPRRRRHCPSEQRGPVRAPASPPLLTSLRGLLAALFRSVAVVAVVQVCDVCGDNKAFSTPLYHDQRPPEGLSGIPMPPPI